MEAGRDHDASRGAFVERQRNAQNEKTYRRSILPRMSLIMSSRSASTFTRSLIN